MTSLVSPDISAIVSSIPGDMLEVLCGIRHLAETSVAQNRNILDIFALLATQVEQIKERDQSIMVMQSKIDSQQAIIEEIRSEQRLLTDAVASLSQSHAQDAVSVRLSPPDIQEIPEHVTRPTTPKSGASITISLPEQPTSRPAPGLVSNAPSDTNDVNVSTTAPDNTWRMPDCYAKTQRGGVLRRQGAFYGTPDWHAMTITAGGVSDSGAPPSPSPAGRMAQEDMMLTLRKVRADVNRKLEARETTDAVTTPTKVAGGDDGDGTSDASPRSFSKHFREPDTVTTPTKVAGGDDGDGTSDASPRSFSKRFREPDAVTTPTKIAGSDDGDGASDASPRSFSKRFREPDEPEKTANPMDISNIIHDSPDGSSSPLLSPSSPGHCPVQDDASDCDSPTKRRRLSKDVAQSPAVPEKKCATRRSPRREFN